MIYDDEGSSKMLAGAENGFIYKFGNLEGNLTGVFSVESSFQNMFEGTVFQSACLILIMMIC